MREMTTYLWAWVADCFIALAIIVFLSVVMYRDYQRNKAKWGKK
jgi:hypothetical protein